MKRNRRGWVIEKAGVDGDTGAILAAFFDRLDRVVPSRLGAGQPMDEAFDRFRWARELEGDLLETPGLAGAIVDRLARRLDGAQTIDDFRDRLAEVKAKTVKIAYVVDQSEQPLSPHVLYRLFSSGGALLYIGITDRGPRRWIEHARTKPWFGSVARFEIERCPSREDALRREREAIEAEGPIYNRMHNHGRRAG